MRTINLSSGYPHRWIRQLPDEIPEWGGWRFVFNAENNEDYDYLVVYNDLHAAFVPQCPHENMIHIRSEPAAFYFYGDKFLSQFARIITHDKNTEHPGAIHHHGGLAWYIGTNPSDWTSDWHYWDGWRPEGWIASEESRANELGFHQMRALFDQPKSKLMSVISTKKAFTQSYKDRIQFTLDLKKYYGDKIDHYGYGFNDMDDKLESLQEYRFQIVIENALNDHYFSEKLTDCMIAGTYPIYHGCPNIDLYFPKNSYIPINLYDFNEAVGIINDALEHEPDKKYRSELAQARDLVFDKYNLFPMLVSLIEKIEQGEYGPPNPITLYGEKILPRRTLERGVFR